MAHSHDDLEFCRAQLEQLSEYVDGELAAEFCREVERHMADCPDCTIVFDTLTKTISLYRALAGTSPELPAGVEERLFHRLSLLPGF